MHRIVSTAALLLAAAWANAQDGHHYRLDLAGSDLHWRVYSAGAFARLGHNHVISAGAMTGEAEALQDGEIRFSLELPAEALVVDDPALRKRYGEAFASEPSAEDIAGTRRNMLGSAVLDAERYPTVRVHGHGPLQAGEVMLDLTVELAGRTAELVAPATIELDGDALVAEGAFRLAHTELGLKPFSVMMGALQVADPIDFAYRIRAERVAAALTDQAPAR